MKKISLIKSGSILLLLSIMTMLFVGCGGSDDDGDDETSNGNWLESSTFDGNSRSGAVSFTIGDKGYLVGGFDGDDYLADTWEYDSTGDFWVAKAPFPGVARSGAVAFAIDGKGYVGTGYDGDNELKDFYAYDPVTDTWTTADGADKIADFPGTERFGAIGFAVGGDGYVGTGNDGSQQKDFYKYDVASNTWEQAVGFGGEKRQDASVFVINDVAYIGLGINNGLYEEDFYSFDGTNWTRLNDLDSDDSNTVLLSGGAAFSLNGNGYIATGIFGGVLNQVWEYTPSTDSWNELATFEGVARQDASAFTFDDKGFVLMGRSGSFYFDDVWELKPNELANEDD